MNLLNDRQTARVKGFGSGCCESLATSLTKETFWIVCSYIFHHLKPIHSSFSIIVYFLIFAVRLWYLDFMNIITELDWK